MHTDEYEISLNRELAGWRKLVKRLGKLIEGREKKYGFTTEALLKGFEEGRYADSDRDFREWCRDHNELQILQKRVAEYEAALRSVKDT